MPHPLVVDYRFEEFDVFIGRPFTWGNRFIVGRDGTRDEVIDKHERWFLRQPALVAKAKAELRGKRLGCVCAPRR